MALQSMNEKIRLQRLKRMKALIVKEVQWQKDVATLSAEIAAAKAKLKKLQKVA